MSSKKISSTSLYSRLIFSSRFQNAVQHLTGTHVVGKYRSIKSLRLKHFSSKVWGGKLRMKLEARIWICYRTEWNYKTGNWQSLQKSTMTGSYERAYSKTPLWPKINIQPMQYVWDNGFWNFRMKNFAPRVLATWHHQSQHVIYQNNRINVGYLGPWRYFRNYRLVARKSEITNFGRNSSVADPLT